MRSRPELIARYLQRNVSEPEHPGIVRLTQTGTMRLKPDARWSPFTAEQWLSPTRVAFCWRARVRMSRLVTAAVEDAFEDGHGRLIARVWGLFTVARGKGAAVDRGEMQRYLAELPWNPCAMAINPQLKFEGRDDRTVRVWTNEPSLYVDLIFDDDGNIVRTFTDARPRDSATSAPWSGEFSDFTEMNGVRFPRHAEVSWHLPNGTFTYWKGDITDLHRDPHGVANAS